MKARFLITCSAAAVLALAAATPAFAQSGDDSAAAADNGGLSDIIVTAQKRAQNVQDVPIAIQAITGNQLAASGIVNTEDLKTSFPGVNIRTTSSQLQPFIRGVGTATSNVENPVAFYIDGVYYASSNDARRDLNDIEQVAVLKGPQGTLFGRNATAGVIQITTLAPSHTAGGNISVGIDNFATLRTSAYLTGPISNTLAFSLSGNFVKQFSGWGKNLVTGKDIHRIDHNGSIRGKLLFQPDDVTDITLIGDFTDRLDDLGAYYVPYPGTAFSPLDGYVPTGIYDTRAGSPTRNRYIGGGVSLRASRELGFAKLESISAFRHFVTGYSSDVDSTPALGFALDTSNTHGKTFSQELQLTSLTGGKLNWTVGIYYFYYRNSLDPVTRRYGGPLFAPNPTSFIRRDIHSSETANSIAPFVQADYEFLPKTKLTLGFRWTYEKRELNGTFSGTQANGTYVPNIIAPIVGATLTAKKPTWRIALDHEFSDDILGYLSYNRGFKSGGYNISNLLNPSYQPEQLDAYEAGLKTELADKKVRLNIAGFYYKYSNLQILQLVGGANTITNGAKAELYGLDVDFEARVARGLRLSGGFELLHTEFTDYRNAAISSPVAGGGILIVVGDATGNRLPAAQKFSGNIALDYTTAVSFGSLAFNATTSYNGDYYFEADNFAKQPAYVLANLSVNWTDTSKHLTAGVFVRNLGDEKVMSYVTSFGGLGYVTNYDNPPRTYGVTIKYSF